MERGGRRGNKGTSRGRGGQVKSRGSAKMLFYEITGCGRGERGGTTSLRHSY